MKRFQFRLDRLLRLKQQKERLAELGQLRARAAVEAAERDVKTKLGRVTEIAAAVKARTGCSVEPGLWLAQYQHMAHLQAAVDAAEKTASHAHAALDEADRCRRMAAAEVEALGVLRQQAWRRHTEQTARVQQNLLDEICLNRWRRADSDSPPQNESGTEVMA